MTDEPERPAAPPVLDPATEPSGPASPRAADDDSPHSDAPHGGATTAAPATLHGDHAEAAEPPDSWDRAAAWILARGALPTLALITLGMIALYAGVFRGEIAGDDLTFHMAESARIADCLRVGDFDLWNPSANAGFASAYYYQVVPQLASAIPAAAFGHHLFFFQLSVFLPLVLAPAAAYRGMRLFGATPWQAAIAALAIALHNGQSRWGTGNAGTFSVGLYTQTWALAAFPIALGYAFRWATEAKQLASAIAWGAFVTLCHPFAGVSLGLALIAGWLAQTATAVLDRLVAPLGDALLETDAAAGPGALGAILTALGERWCDAPRPWLGAAIRELLRLALLAGCLVVAWMPIWLPLIADYDGFGGFPHRVNDEVGPGFGELARWYTSGGLFDHARPLVLTCVLPVVAVLFRAQFLRWLWGPAILFALSLGVGPHLGKTDNDLLPAVRFLGAMQVVVTLAIGAGAVSLIRTAWNAPEGSLRARCSRGAIVAAGLIGASFVGYRILTSDGTWGLELAEQITFELLPPTLLQWLGAAVLTAIVGAATWPVWKAMRTEYGRRTAIVASAAVLLVLLIGPGIAALDARVRVLPDYPGSHGRELHEVTQLLQRQPPGRKQVGPGAENHWWNLLSYEYGRRPSLLMMGGGGLQASPNYDFLWSVKDVPKMAWVYDAPILIFEKKSAAKMPAGVEILATKNYQGRRLRAAGLVSPVQITGSLPPGRKPARAAAIDWLRSDQAMQDRVLEYAPPGTPEATPTRPATAPTPSIEGSATDAAPTPSTAPPSTAPPSTAPTPSIVGSAADADEPAGFLGSGEPTNNGPSSGAAPDAPDAARLGDSEPRPASPGPVLRAFRQDSPGDAADIYADVDATAPTTFVARESWHPRWHVYVDGVEAVVRRVTPDFPAVDVPAGRHRIEWRFERPWWVLASWVAWPLVPLLAYLLHRLVAQRAGAVQRSRRAVTPRRSGTDAVA